MKTKIRATMFATVAAAALVAGLTGIAQARTPSTETATAAAPTSGDAVVGDAGARAGEQLVAGRHDRPGDRTDGRDRRGGNDHNGRNDGRGGNHNDGNHNDGDHNDGDHNGGRGDGDHNGGHDDGDHGGGSDDDHGTRHG